MAAPAPVNQFDVARKRAATQETANLQGQGDAIKRRMASMGGGPSGAMVKMENQARDDSAKRLATANEGIDVAEQGENRRVAEIKEQRDFQRGEREAGQQFARGERLGSQDFGALQAEAQRKYQTGERMSSQEFAALEAGKGRDFARGERLGSQEFAAGESKLGRDLQSSQFDRNMNFQQDEAFYNRNFRQQAFNQEQENFLRTFNANSEQFMHQKYIDQKNLDLSARIQKYNESDPGFFGSIFKGGDGRRGGFLGIG